MANTYRLPKYKRLTHSKQYQFVFKNAKRYRVNGLISLNRKNSNETARLGVIIAKRDIKKASCRNHFKRLIRESFRYHQQQLQGLDIIILVKRTCADQSNQEIFQNLAQLWQRLNVSKKK